MLALAENVRQVKGEVIGPDDPLRIITILNPFNPREFESIEQPFHDGLVVRDLMPAVLAHCEYVVSVNGGVVEPENYGCTHLNPGDNVVMCPVPQGGGGGAGKTILRIVALIVVTYFTYGAGDGWLVGADSVTGFAAGSFGAMVVQAGVFMAGAALVNAMLPVKPSSLSTADNQDTATYGIDGAKNVSLEGIPVPVCYGQFRMAGNIIGLYVENVDTTQMVYMLLNAGEGPVFNISDIYLNDQPLSNFKDVEWTTRMGTADQDLIDWFHDSFTDRNLGVKVPADQSWYTYQTPGSLDKFRIDLVCPNGLFKASKSDGSLGSYDIPLQIQYRPLGGSTWTDLLDYSTIAGTSTTQGGTPDGSGGGDGTGPGGTGGGGSGGGGDQIINIDDPYDPILTQPSSGTKKLQVKVSTDTQQPLYGAQIKITDKIRSPVRRSFSSQKLAQGQYEIRIRRNTTESTDEYISDQVYVSDIYEINTSPLNYKYTALVAIKVKLTDQLNGVPNVTYINHGRVIRAWDRTTNSWVYSNNSNPAWITLDMLQHTRYGGQLADDRIDIEAFKRWAKYCYDNNLQFNGVLDAEMKMWDAMQYVCRMGHAQLVNVGTRYSVAIEGPDTPMMMFGMGNIEKGSFKLNWLPMADRANEIDVTFFDKTNLYKQTTIKVYDQAILNEGFPQRTAQITLFGCTDETTAVKEGILQLNLNKYLLQTCEFDAPVEALACTVGSLIYVQHNMPVWEASGRLAAGSTNQVLQLDSSVTLDPAGQYRALVLYPTAEVGTGSVTAVDATNGYVILSNALPTSFRRITVGGKERGAQAAQSDGANVVWVDDCTGISVGDAYTLYDTDVIVEQDVVNSGNTTTTVTLTAPLSQGAPAEFSNWMLGPVTKVKRKFRVKSITAASKDFKRHVIAIQYDDRTYNIDTSGYNTPTGTTGSPDDPGGNTGYALSNVQNLSLWEEVYVSGAQVKNRVVLAWSPPKFGIYQGADVWVRTYQKDGTPGEAWRQVGSIVGSPRFPMDADIGTRLQFKVVAFDMFGKRVPFESSPSYPADTDKPPYYTVLGTATTPPVPRQPSGVNVIFSGKDCKLYWRYNSKNNSYDIGSEPYGADSGFLDPSVLDFQVDVYQNINSENGGGIANPDWKKVRTDYVTAPNYTYTYEHNVEDGGPHRHLKFSITVRMKVGAPSPAATITAYNPPPSAVTPVLQSVGFESALVKYDKPSDPDFDGVVIYMGPTQPVAHTADNLIYDGPNTAVAIMNLASDSDYYVDVGAYDTFGKVGMQFGSVHLHTTMFDVQRIANSMIGIDLLDATLRSRIDLVDGDMPGSVNARILGEANDRQAAVDSEASARQTADSSQAQRTDSVYAALAGTGSAAEQEGVLAQLNADGGVSYKFSALATQVDNNAAAILTEQTARADADSANASSITTLSSTVDHKNRTFYQTTAPVSDSNYSLVVGDLWIDTDAGNKLNRWNGSAWIAIKDPGSIKNRTFTQSTAPTNPISVTDTDDNGNLVTISYKLQPGDLWIDTANDNIIYAWDGSSWANKADLRTGRNTTSIQTIQSTTDGLGGQYTVKIDNNGYVTSFGLASQAVQTGDHTWKMASTFEVVVDSFQVRMPGPTSAPGTGYIPFAVGNVTLDNGTTVTRVTIDKAAIADATITNAKITGIIKSDDYAAGVRGWKIDKAGNAEVASLSIRGWVSGSVTVPNNSTGTVTHGLGRTPIVAVWHSSGTATLHSCDSNAFSIGVSNAGDTVASYSYA